LHKTESWSAIEPLLIVSLDSIREKPEGGNKKFLLDSSRFKNHNQEGPERWPNRKGNYFLQVNT
jgi:hypothetical protein